MWNCKLIAFFIVITLSNVCIGEDGCAKSWKGQSSIVELINYNQEQQSKLITEVSKKYPKTQRTIELMGYYIDSFDPFQVASLQEIPFQNSRTIRPKTARGKMIERISDLDPLIAKTILAVYNKLNDREYINDYLARVYLATVASIARRNKIDEGLAEKGRIKGIDLIRTIIINLKSKVGTNFSNVKEYGVNFGRRNFEITDNANYFLNFRRAIAHGPFIDDFDTLWKERTDHGAYTHLIQHDIVIDTIKENMGENYQDFWKFLGTKVGINWWIDTFDSGVHENRLLFNMNRPEFLNELISHTIIQD